MITYTLTAHNITADDVPFLQEMCKRLKLTDVLIEQYE